MLRCEVATPHWVVAALFALALLPVRFVQAQVAVTSASPGAVSPGKTTEILLVGQKLEDPLAVWTSFPAKVELLPVEAAGRKVKLTLEESVPLGIGGIVVANSSGISSPLFVMIDDLASVAEVSTNNSAASPQDVTLPQAIDGASGGPQSDYFRLNLAQGQRISCDVVAARLGSDFDPVLRLLDGAGRELAAADDDPSLGADARLTFTAPAAGPYLLELRDNRYKAGGRYRLRIGALPLAATAFPAGGTAGTALTTTLIPHEGEPIPATLPLPPSPFETSLFASGKVAGSESAGYALVRTGALPEIVEPAAVEKPEEGTPVTLPLTINGRITEAQQRDRYAFTAKKGERWNFQAYSRSFGSPAVVALRVLNAAGGQVIASTPTEAEEESLIFTAPDDGTYRLEVEDLLQRGGPTFVYRISATAGPLFNLVAKNDPATRFQHLLAPGGGAFVFDVQVQRNGYDGPIQLSAISPRVGFTLEPAVMPEKVNELRVYVTPPADFHAGELVDLRIAGKANVGPGEHTAVAKNGVQLRAARPHLPHAPAWLEGGVFVGFADQAAFYTLAPAMAEVSIAQGGQAMVPFAFERTHAEFKDVPLTLLLSGLPAGVTHEVKPSGIGPKESHEVTFKVAPEAPEGKHAIHWRGYVEFQGRGRIVAGDLQLVVTKPATP
jgi:hypothetical protein